MIRHGSEMVDFAEFVALVFDGRADDAIAFGERKRGEMIDEAAGMWQLRARSHRDPRRTRP